VSRCIGCDNVERSLDADLLCSWCVERRACFRKGEQAGLRAGLAMAAAEAKARAQAAERLRDECIAKGREVMAEYHDGASQMGASLAQWMREAATR
jgi:hypothetical protein